MLKMIEKVFDKLDDFGLPIVFAMLIVFGLGLLIYLCCFGFISYMTILSSDMINQAKHLALQDTFKTFLPPIGILLGSQIAGFAVYRNMIFQKKTKQEQELEQQKLSDKILTSYLRHLQELGKEQIEFFDSIYHDVSLNGTHLKDLKLSNLFYDEQLNESAFVQTINDMLSHDLHKYNSVVSIEFILDIKQEILKVIHYVKLIKEVYIPNNDRVNLIHIISDIKDIIETLNIDINNALQK